MVTMRRAPALSVVEGPAGEGWGFADPFTPPAGAHCQSSSRQVTRSTPSIDHEQRRQDSLGRLRCQLVAREDASHIPHMRVDRGGLIV
jgi:hypothetical protein